MVAFLTSSHYMSLCSGQGGTWLRRSRMCTFDDRSGMGTQFCNLLLLDIETIASHRNRSITTHGKTLAHTTHATLGAIDAWSDLHLLLTHVILVRMAYGSTIHA